MLRQVVHKVRCLASERLHKIIACKDEVRYRNLTSKSSDMITQLWSLSLTKQRNLCITVERRAIRITLSPHGTYVCSKMILLTVSSFIRLVIGGGGEADI